MAKKSASKKPVKSKFITEYKKEKLTVDGVIRVWELGRELLVVRINDYRNKKSLVIQRLWHTDNGEWAPGKGAFIPASTVDELLSFLQNESKNINNLLGNDS